MIPLCSFTKHSGPPQRVAMTGIPQDSASRYATPNVSDTDAITKQSHCCRRWAISSLGRSPSISMRPSMFKSVISLCKEASSSPCPQMVRVTFGQSRNAFANALIRTSILLILRRFPQLRKENSPPSSSISTSSRSAF